MTSTSRPFVLSFLGSLSLLACTACAPPAPVVVHPGDASMIDGLVVHGTGKITAKPDMAKASFGVMIRARSAEQATTEANVKIAGVLQIVQGLGVAEDDVRTQHVSLYEERDEFGGGRPVDGAAESSTSTSPLPATHYVAQNLVEITVRDLNRLGEILGAVTRAGVNQMNGVEFGLQDPAPSRAQARELAVADAKRQAEEMARSAGVKLGRIVSIRANGMDHSPMYAEAMGGKMAAAVPVAPGTLAVHESVELRFEIVAE